MPDFLPPSALELPAKFLDWRPDQIEAVQRIIDTPSRFVALTMPTGSGKTLPYMAASKLLPGRTVVLTSTNGLLDQLSQEFSGFGFASVRGQRHYPCHALEPGGEWHHEWYPGASGALWGRDLSAAEGPCHLGHDCSLRAAGCAYWDAVRSLAQRSGFTNYAWWTSTRLWNPHALGAPADLLVLDEAHAAFDELSQAVRIELSRADLSRFQIPIPERVTRERVTKPRKPCGNPVEKSGVTKPHQEPQPETWGTDAEWCSWAKVHVKTAQRAASFVQDDLVLRRRLLRLARSLTRLAQIDPSAWVEAHDDHTLAFDCLEPGQFAEDLLWQEAKKVVLVSATLTRKTLELLGIPDASHWECPSRFPLANRPVYLVGTVRVDYRMRPEHYTALVARIDQILDQRPKVKGVIHTVSYRLLQAILARSRHSARMVTHGREPGAIQRAVDTFKASTDPAILLSPAVTTGYDFPGDDCRVQILVKLPFPDSRVPIVSARNSLDKDYAPYATVQQLVQMVGRGVRSSHDWCETLILDEHAGWFLNRYRSLAPRWFMQSVVRQSTLPRPLKGAR